METAGAVAFCVLALAVGWYSALLWARRVGIAVLLGLIVGAGCLAFYFLVAGWVETFWPDILDSHVIGRRLVLLVVALPACGVLGSLFGYRHVMGRWRY
jgi:hypothetical protein